MRDKLLRTFLRQRLILLTLALAANALAVHTIATFEALPQTFPQRLLPETLAKWVTTQTLEMGPDTLVYLKLDDYVYCVCGRGHNSASLFLAYFQSQRGGLHLRSLRHCLPPSGWVTTRFAGRQFNHLDPEMALKATELVVEKSQTKAIVLYWSENPQRTFAAEIVGKLYLLPDLLRYRKSDITLVRILNPHADGGEHPARFSAPEIAADLFPPLRSYFSNRESL